ncbi:fumarylacetoacetate hydrolase family protein [Paenibacillus popilliae]|uniref:2-keto-4-pentenoate hydratase/2-oxohepta-3-ene-1,7-dioic acid hydratase n=1 Tax=Paenibacillus popilliae ATCC 14706 TaxID=1212764 RepID=M9LBN7_PAEPP|nr:fumarylacetoacetate hydrolase family protein [Paenibacillus popilliae]GAC43307.1 2-keto-4-pentenoate hydratase/2-oxohepta-3-ene-1,7-dioic acid hydratase [Paenibacillus popilliae ATCC 14706]
MKFVTFDPGTGAPRSGWLRDGCVVDIRAVSEGRLPGELLELVRHYEDVMEEATRIDRRLGPDAASLLMHPGVYPVADVALFAPIPKPPSVRDFYAFEAHVIAARWRRGLDIVPEWYRFPVFYFSNHQAIVGPNALIRRPAASSALDFELEVACVIGKEGRDIAAEEANAYIFGYCIMNDWSARDLQQEEVKVGLGPAKGKDFATSLGPYLVTKDELERHRAGERHELEMAARVNGVELSRGNLRDLHYSFGDMIARASADATLYPGDIIGSGTVGTGCILERGPEVHRWLEPGDVVELDVTGLGLLRNTIG